MRRLIMWNLVTLDGFFESGKWDIGFHDQVWGEELERLSLEQLRAADTLLFGRVTYEGMASYWPTETGEIADFMNAIPKVVFSTTLETAAWNNTVVVRSDAEGAVAALKRKPGKDILVFGSARLCSTLMPLIDEIRLGVTPVVLGAGSPLFKPALAAMRMRLLEARPLATGCVVLRYAPLAAT